MTGALEQTAMLMTLMRELEGVMQAQGAAIREMRLERMRELEAEKTALADRYEVALRQFRRSPELVAGLDLPTRGELETATRRFQAAAQANAKRLAKALGVIEDIVRLLGQSMAAGRTGSGYRVAASPTASGALVSLSLNRHA